MGLPGYVAELRWKRFSIIIAAIPIDDRIDLQVSSRDGEHEGVADVRGGFCGDWVIEYTDIGRLRHPPDDHSFRLSFFGHAQGTL